MNTSKLTNLMFQNINNVSYDLATGATAIKTDSGLISLSKDHNSLEQNPFDSFAMEIPAFAILTPIKDIAVGDLIVSNGKAVGFVVLAEGDDLEVLSVDGNLNSHRPRTIQFLGQAAGVQVVKSLLSFGNNSEGPNGLFSNPLMLMMMMGDGKKDLSKMLPFLLMGNSGASSGMNPLMLMAMMGDKSPFA
jgi:hypothetical protein